ncbi:uncharacterized protein CDAR_94271 [Caerostris darwini]|uniref:Uncharacterized protein n=1 Tax=Caerostris darwini TaxID=1538125 RepID=A0AAV4VQB8_9ARAC|nr:uncharacterized protein CDAR_94271 [Caerostris darwini]
MTFVFIIINSIAAQVKITLCGLLACIVQTSPTYYRPYYRERASYVEENRGDRNGFREYDEGSNHNRQKLQASHGASAKEDYVKKTHDKGFYEREKKYGYEKSYGYERETKSHDKGSTNQGHKDGFEYNESKRDHKSGEQFLRDLADEGKKYNRGSQTHGSKLELHESSSNHKIGKDIESELDSEFRNSDFFKRSGPIADYSPNYIPHEYMFGIDNTLQRFRYLSGIHGLGGIRANALSYGYNPLRYKYLENYMDDKFFPFEPLNFDIENPHSRVLYLDS